MASLQVEPSSLTCLSWLRLWAIRCGSRRNQRRTSCLTWWRPAPRPTRLFASRPFARRARSSSSSWKPATAWTRSENYGEPRSPSSRRSPRNRRTSVRGRRTVSSSSTWRRGRSLLRRASPRMGISFGCDQASDPMILSVRRSSERDPTRYQVSIWPLPLTSIVPRARADELVLQQLVRRARDLDLAGRARGTPSGSPCSRRRPRGRRGSASCRSPGDDRPGVDADPQLETRTRRRRSRSQPRLACRAPGARPSARDRGSDPARPPRPCSNRRSS